MSDVQRKENRKILSRANNERSYQAGGAMKAAGKAVKGLMGSKKKKKKKNAAPDFKFKMPTSSTKPRDTKMPASRTKPKGTKMPIRQAGGTITDPGRFKQLPKPVKKKTGINIEIAQQGTRLQMGTYPPGYMDSVMKVRRVSDSLRNELSSQPRARTSPPGYLTGQEWGERYDPGFTIKDTVPGGWGNKYDPGMTIKDTVPGGWGNKYDPGFTRKLPPVQFPKELGGNNPQQYQMGGVLRWLKKQTPDIMRKGHAWVAKNYPDQYKKYFPQVPSTKVKPTPGQLPPGPPVPKQLPRGGGDIVPVPKPGPVVPVPKPGPLVPIPGPIKPPIVPPSGGGKKWPWWLLPIAGAGIYEATRGAEHPTQPPVTPLDPRGIEETIATEPEATVKDRGEAPPGRPSFDITFMEARNAGLPEFDWVGPDGISRRYTTRTAEEDAMYKSQEASKAAGPFTMDSLDIPMTQDLDTTLAGPAPETETLAENLAGREGGSRRRYYRNDRQENRKGARILYDKGTGERKTSRKTARRDRKELKKEVRGIRKEDRQEKKVSRKEQRGVRKADKKERKNEGSK